MHTSFAVVTRCLCGTRRLGQLGCTALRQRNFDLAAQRLERARNLTPQDGHIYNLLGILDSERQFRSAIANFMKTAKLNPKDLRNIYAPQEYEKKGGPK